MCGQKLSDEACKNIIRGIALKHKVDPKLIVTRLLSPEDKDDMRRGELPIESLALHVELWIKAGMPDYAHGKTEPLNLNDIPSSSYPSSKRQWPP